MKIIKASEVEIIPLSDQKPKWIDYLNERLSIPWREGELDRAFFGVDLSFDCSLDHLDEIANILTASGWNTKVKYRWTHPLLVVFNPKHKVSFWRKFMR